jgi:uncharacterized membrane protein
MVNSYLEMVRALAALERNGTSQELRMAIDKLDELIAADPEDYDTVRLARRARHQLREELDDRRRRAERSAP